MKKKLSLETKTLKKNEKKIKKKKRKTTQTQLARFMLVMGCLTKLGWLENVLGLISTQRTSLNGRSKNPHSEFVILTRPLACLQVDFKMRERHLTGSPW